MTKTQRRNIYHDKNSLSQARSVSLVCLEIYDPGLKYITEISNIVWDLIFIRNIFSPDKSFPIPQLSSLTDLFLPPGVKFRRQHWLFLLICLLVFVIILSIYLPIAGRVDNIEVGGEVGRWCSSWGRKCNHCPCQRGLCKYFCRWLRYLRCGSTASQPWH